MSNSPIRWIGTGFFNAHYASCSMLNDARLQIQQVQISAFNKLIGSDSQPFQQIARDCLARDYDLPIY